MKNLVGIIITHKGIIPIILILIIQVTKITLKGIKHRII